MLLDARVPVVFGTLADLKADDALLIESERMPDGQTGIAFLPGPGILALGCACCAPRGPLARALGDLFTQRARGDVPFFRRVLAVPTSPDGGDMMRAALTQDPVCGARFRVT